MEMQMEEFAVRIRVTNYWYINDHLLFFKGGGGEEQRTDLQPRYHEPGKREQQTGQWRPIRQDRPGKYTRGKNGCVEIPLEMEHTHQRTALCNHSRSRIPLLPVSTRRIKRYCATASLKVIKMTMTISHNREG